MLRYPDIDPVLFSIGPLQLHWYGLMYVLGFIATYLLVQKQIREFAYTALEKHFEGLNTVLILCVIVGGRLGYVLFYSPAYFLDHPLEIFATWNGGMSFHGACFTLFLGGLLYCRKRLNFWKVADIYTATFPIGLFLGRIGNFINGELYGRTTTAAIGMVFPAGGPSPRHPSQLYEALFEGLILFLLLWSLRKRPWTGSWPHGSIFCIFLLCYGFFRILIENFREPDPQLGFLFSFITMGQVLSGLMVLCGLGVLAYLNTRKT